MNWKYEIETSNGDHFIIRFFPSHRNHLIQFEPDVIKRCWKIGAAVPEILLDSRNGPPSNWEYSVYRMLSGTSLDTCIETLTVDETRSVAGRVYEEMSAIAQLSLIGFGELKNAEKGQCKSWREFIWESVALGLPNAIQHYSLRPDLSKILTETLTKLIMFKPLIRPTLAWGDVSPTNIIVNDEKKFVGLIDFEGTLGAEMALNIGYLRARSHNTLFCQMVQEFWNPTDEQCLRADLYTVIRALRILRYATQPLPLGSKRDPIEDFLPGLEPAIKRLHACSTEKI